MEQKRGIRYFPIALFASVMGLSGVTMAIKLLENLYEWNQIASTSLLILTTLLFLFNSGMLIYRLFRYRADVKADFNHPVKMNFFGAVSISLLLLAAAYLDVSNTVSYVLWIVGAVLQITLTLVILSRLIWTFSFKIEHFNAAWFIPIVGNIVVPIAGSTHAIPDINWFFFSIGVIFSIVYMTIFFIRVFFHPPIPGKLLPTFFILMAPPAVGFISYLNITGSADAFAYILYGAAFFIGMLLLFRVKIFLSIPFFLSWWAFLFPSAAMTLATFRMALISHQPIYEILFNIQVIGLIVLAIYLSWKTIQLAAKRSLCVKEG